MKFKLAVLGLLVALGSSSAAVMGLLGLGSAGGVDATITSLTFLPDPSSVPPGPPWDAEVTNTTTLSFAGGPLNSAEGVEINQNTPFIAGVTPLPEDYFFRFAAHANLDFSLSGVIPSGASSNCSAAILNGQSCSLFIAGIGLSPVILTSNGAGGTTASISFFGKASDTGSAGIATGSNWNGNFAPTISDLTPDQIAVLLCPNYNATNSCSAADVAANRTLHILSNSGSFQVVMAPSVPEPSTISMIGIGAAMVLVGFLRKKKAIS